MLVTDTRKSVSYLILMVSPSEISFPPPSSVLRICRCSTTPRHWAESRWRVGLEKLTWEEKQEIERIYDEKLEDYYRQFK